MEPSPPLNENEKLAATLAALELERDRRVQAGSWTRERPRLQALCDREPFEAAQQRALYAYLAEHPDAPKTIAAYDWVLVEVVSPPPVVELPSEQFDRPADMIDVTPWRPPAPAPAPPAAPPAPTPTPAGRPSNVGIPPRVHAKALRQLARFEADEYSPDDAPLRYPRMNRTGY